MDPIETPRRRWWRKKRWWATLVLWSLVAYPLALGPIDYAEERGWLSYGFTNAVHAPMSSFGTYSYEWTPDGKEYAHPFCREYFNRCVFYWRWWIRLAKQHAGEERREIEEDDAED